MADIPNRTQTLTCSKCGNELGKMLYFDDFDLLEVGSFIVDRIDANCKKCGQPFHYSLTAQNLKRLIRRNLERRTG